MNINALFDSSRIDLSNCEIGDLVVYTVTKGNTFNIGYVTFNGWSDSWQQNIVKLDGTIAYFDYSGNWLGNPIGDGYAIKRFPKHTLRFKCTSDRI